MNKILIFSILTMTLIGILSVNIGLSEDIDYNDETITGNGVWVKNTNDDWAWYNNNTNHYYVMYGTGDWLNVNFNPTEHQDRPFRIYNTDTGDWEYYVNYDGFVDKYGGSNIVPTRVNIFDTSILWALIVGALTVGLVAGIQIFGSGLSEWAQYMAFNHAAYGGLWLTLSVLSSDVLLDSIIGWFGTLLYFGLTFLFIIGLIIETSDGA